MDFFTHALFYNIILIGAMGYTDFPNVVKFSYTMSKITFICEKSLNFGKLQSHISDVTFPKF